MDQSELSLKDQETTDNGPVECLGKTFANDEERRTYFLGLLAEKLKDPEFRKIEGFPIGEDEDILNLSDPPYYTACPNPWIPDFIAEWEAQKPSKTEDYHCHREPFAADVSEGKNDPIYNAHSYHTKVPHKAIMRYILHYTDPGDIVFDGFAGTGMTGIAAQMCGDKTVVHSLGYQIRPDGVILQNDSDNLESAWQPISKLGIRHSVLNDLSPAATFIAHNYNSPVNPNLFKQESDKLLKELEDEFGWMYETLHSDGITKGVINYTVWSDVYVCSECANEVVFWDVAVDLEKGTVRDSFPCPDCHANLTKRKMDRAWVSKYDAATKKTIKQLKQKPVLINYSIPGNSRRFKKSPDKYDIDLINRVESENLADSVPTNNIIDGKEIGRLRSIEVLNVHQLLPKRANIILGELKKRSENFSRLLIGITASLLNLSWMYRWRANGKGGTTSGTYYICSTPQENNVFGQLRTKYNDLIKVISDRYNVVSTQDSSTIVISDDSIDYIFLDPPFGSNLMYSELSFLWESWLRIWTNNIPEAIENSTQGKGTKEYRDLMADCFKEAYRILKPGRWMTVEFSNTKASVWNSIQTALNEAGFIIANVSALDKKQGSFKAVTTTTAVKQDLVISAYKPNGGFEDRFVVESNEDAIWDFVRTHLGYLPISKKQSGELVKIPERDPRILFDQVVAYFVRNLRDVPISSREFQDGLRERYTERDGMIFLPEQVAQYDKARISATKLRQLTIFVDDESSSIEWLRQLLNDKPQTYQDIHPKFINELTGWKKAEFQLELSTLLEQNFIKFDGNGQVPPQIHSYLSSNFKELRNLPNNDSTLLRKAKDRWYVPNPEREEDLQQIRERDLLKQFDEYKQHQGKKLKLVRMEAVRCGFKKAWQDRDYKTIIDIAEKIPQSLLQEDSKLLMWYDQAITRSH